MTDLIVVKGDEQTDLSELLGGTYFQGMNAEYLREVFDGLCEEQGEDAAWNWVEQLKLFGPSTDEFNLDSMGFDLDEDEEEDLDLDEAGGDSSDPLRVATLVQSNTQRPANVFPGQFFDKLTETVVANTFDPEGKKGGQPLDVPGCVLLYHSSRTLFEDGKSPVCWSKDGVVNREGMLCKVCSHYGAITCTKQLNMVWCNQDFSGLFKLSFAKTGYKLGLNVTKRLRTQKLPFSKLCDLSVEAESNNKGSWFVPSVSITKEATPEWTQKAMRVLAEAYMTFFNDVKKRLKKLHKEYKEHGGSKQLGLAGMKVAGALPAGPQPGTPGVDGYFGSQPPAVKEGEGSPEAGPVNINDLE